MVLPVESTGDLVPAQRVVSPTLVSRDTELRSLGAAIRAAPAVVVVSGEAGIGKTRLVAELSTRDELAGRRFVTGCCRRIREPFPLGPVVDAVRSLGENLATAGLTPVAGTLRPLLPEIAHLLPPRPEPLEDRVADRHRVFRGLIEVLTALGPAVLVIEDLHWADELTGDFLAYLVADPPATLSLVLTFRTEEVSPAVRALTTAVPTSVTRAHVSLSPLDAERTGALAAAVLGTDEISREFAEYLCQRAAGLPYAVEELLALLRARNLLVRSPHGWARRELDELDVPDRIRDAVLERAARLGGAAGAVLRAAAVVQVPVPPPVLAEVADAPSSGVAEALASGLLDESTDGVAVLVGFRHPLAAQAVYEDLPGTLRRELHARAATALDGQRPVALGQLAHHLRQAGRLAEWAVVAERAAGQAAELGHVAEAARLLQDVLVNAPLAADEKGRVATTLAEVSAEALLDERTADLLLPVLTEDLSAPVRGELKFRIGLLLNQLSYDDVLVHRLMAEATADLDHRLDLKAWAMACLGAPLVPGVELAEHVAWLDRSLAVLDQIDDPAVEVHLLGKIASFLAAMGHPRWRLVTERMSARAGAGPRTRPELFAYQSVATERCLLGDVATARRLLDSVPDAVLAGTESRRLMLRHDAGRLLLDFRHGDWTGLAERVAHMVAALSTDRRTRMDVDVVAACLALATG